MESNGNTMYTMPVMPMNYGGGGNGFGNGFGGDGWWILLLFILLGGNNGFGGNGFGGNGLYPWMNQAEVTNSGFQNQTVNDGITSVRDSVSALSNRPYLLLIPAIFICLIVLALNLMGDGLRDAFDPKQR